MTNGERRARERRARERRATNDASASQNQLLVRNSDGAVLFDSPSSPRIVTASPLAISFGAVRARRDEMENGRLSELTDNAAALTISFVEALPHSLVYFKLGGQLLDSGTSTAANYRAAQRARSPADFVAKLKIVEEEADESMLWVDKLRKAGLSSDLRADADRLLEMFDQIVALTVQSIKTTRRRHLSPPRRRRPPQ